jgi:parallel beta-helix repeat protein
MLTLANLNFGPVCTRALNASLNNYPRAICGGSTSCQCGDLLTQSRTLNSSDFTGGACSATGLEIGATGITLDCNGKPIIGSGVTGSTGIKNVWFNNVTIKNCNVSNFDNGIHLKRVSNNVITNNTIYSPKTAPGSGIWVETSTWNNITINNASSYKWGIGFDINSNNNRAIGNNLVSCQYGMEIYNSSRNTIKNNIVNNHTQYGIYMNNGSSTNVLIGNAADFNGRRGLHIADPAAVGNIINNNRFCYNSQTPGIFFDIFDGDTNLGDNNQCNVAFNWNDTSVSPPATGCRYGCLPGTLISTNNTLGVNATVSFSTPVTVIISNVTSVVFMANATAAIAPGLVAATLFANISTKCPPIDWAYIQLYYDESELIVDESTLMMYYWNPTISNWTLISTSGVNSAANYVWANVTHLTVFTGMGRLVHATPVDIDPDSLNLKTGLQWITAYIELTGPHEAADISLESVRLNTTIPAVTDPRYGFVTDSSEYITDVDEDGILERMVKFNRTEVKSLIIEFMETDGWRFGNVTLTVTGEVEGLFFEGRDVIKVIVGDVNSDNAVNVLDLTKVSMTFGTFNDEPLYDWNADVNEDGVIDMKDLFIVARNLGKS